MLVYLLQVYVLLTALISQRPVYACTGGWFGERCTYRCHCAQTILCDLSSGDCPNNGACTNSYFGPGCQFIDRVQLWSHQSTPSFLRDADDSTCNPNSNDTTLELNLDSGHPMSFFRIVVNDNRNLLNFTTTLNGQPCPSEAHFQVADNVIDVTCDIIIQLSALRINGPIVGSICSIYISQGRNVALYQHTSQSSVYRNGNGGSGNAVDGNTNRDYNDDHCSHTDTGMSAIPVWTVTFSRPHILYTAVIYNRDDYQYRLRGIRTESFDKNWDLVMSNVDPSTSSWDTYIAPLFSLEPAIHVKITQSSRWSDDDRVLTLCEVEVYGDTVCDNHTYGLYCQSPCRCNRTDRCHVVTGACALGCLPGFYGFNCLSRCLNCLQGICEWITGNCFQCNPGYIGDKCTTACNPGSYGQMCAERCSTRCASICNHVDGKCFCKEQFTGEYCTECSNGYYGPDCTERCSEGCADICDPVTGTCLCKMEYTGYYCAECSPGYYGSNCRYTCSLGCATPCDPVDGTCFCLTEYTGDYCTECSPGYYGPNCTNVCSERCSDICDPVTGTCLCQVQFTGDYCTECSPGYFGPSCAIICSERCLKPCHPIDGKCVCKMEFTGEYCTDCSPGFYGHNCTNKCSEGCVDMCNNITGSCHCKAEFTGLNCSGCAATFYGAGCSKKCSRNCLGSVCDHMSGMCSSCAPGFDGDNCETGEEEGHSGIFVLLLIPFFLLLSFLVQRREEEEDSEEL